ncbi:MAG TPA: ATP-binding cassette domain-containing protein, partial [Syntrophaceticus sp.]|nr:ATP-binding cassette domain-containing protein [Syntrophaceticus sp.]
MQIKRAGYTDEKNAIRDISFSLKEGELAGLIGPNGAGKSTTIKAIL